MTTDRVTRMMSGETGIRIQKLGTARTAVLQTPCDVTDDGRNSEPPTF